jgi:hypothetical protein
MSRVPWDLSNLECNHGLYQARLSATHSADRPKRKELSSPASRAISIVAPTLRLSWLTPSSPWFVREPASLT